MILASRVAEQIDGVLDGPDVAVTRLGSLDTADASTLCFLMPGRSTTANPGALIQRVGDAPEYLGTRILVVNPYLAFAKASALFDSPWHTGSGLHPSAHIDPSASIADEVQIGPGAVIGADVTLHSKVSIGPNTWIGDGVEIGADSGLAGNVSLYHGVRLGERCRIHSGAVIGADGFGFAPSEQGWAKIHQLGGVWIGADVEIGANTTIDRGALDDTWIADGVKIDNQVMIAHNCKIGRNTAIAACVGMAGSTIIGENCTIAGASGFTGHLSVCDNVHIGAMTLVAGDIRSPGQYAGGVQGARPMRDWKRNVARFNQLDQLARRLIDLEKRQKG